MAIENRATVLRDVEVTIDGETVTQTDVEVGHIAYGQRSDGSELIRLHIGDDTWIWGAPVADWSEAVSDDPADEPRWTAE